MGNPDQPHKPSESLVKIPAPVHTVFFADLIKAFFIDISALLNFGINFCVRGWQRGSHIQYFIPKSGNASISTREIFSGNLSNRTTASRLFPIKSHLAGRAL
ncbi:MAG: hypothetical protein KME15_15425 [Drouetiella hepatica Uher 2000/2452]|jgi:hypothetical protein|uniref:Uncharacterized protein n=1 Tax=Drouetiella hepatica Uher 2000/2452 TaxID=904376 RepID=A0A951UN42_9CYAN|nr:hypothetical protein [Drouetiella hepatica Uher 2000/2452]